MKLKVLWFKVVVVIGCCLTGCSSSPYSIIDTSEGTGQKTVRVEAPVGASEADMKTWAEEIKSKHKPANKEIMINFYNGGRGAKNMIGTYDSYDGGSFYQTRTKK